MSVNTYQHSLELLDTIEATIEHAVRAGQVPQIIINYHYRAPLESSASTYSQSRHDRAGFTEPPGLSALADSRIVTSEFQYKLVLVSKSEPSSRRESTVRSRANASTRYSDDPPLRRSSTGLSTPEPTPPRPPNRAEDPRRCQGWVPRAKRQCFLQPAASRDVKPYGWYCRHHGNTGGMPKLSALQSRMADIARQRSRSPHASLSRETSNRSSSSLIWQPTALARPQAVPSRSWTQDSTPRTHSSTSRPVETTPSPSPEPQPIVEEFSERHASHTRSSPPLRPLRLPKLLGLLPQSSTVHLVYNSPEQSLPSSPSSSPSPSPSLVFRRTHRASGSSSRSVLGWPTTPARSGFRRESSGISTPEPEHGYSASPISASPALPPAFSPVSPGSSPVLSPTLSPTVSPVESLVELSVLSPALTPTVSPLPSPLPSAVSSPIHSSANRPFVFGATSFESVQSQSRCVSPTPYVFSPRLGLEINVTSNSELKQPESSGPADAQDQQKATTFEAKETMVTEAPSTSHTLEPDVVVVDVPAQPKSFEFGKTRMGSFGAIAFSFECPVPPRSRDTIPSGKPQQTTSSIAVPIESTSITDVTEPSTQPQEPTSVEFQRPVPTVSSSPSPVQSPAAIPIQPVPTVQSEAIPISSPASGSLPFVSRLPRPSSAGSLGRVSLDGSRQGLKSRLPSRIPRLATKPRELPRSSENVAPKVHLCDKGVNKGTSQRGSTLGRCSLATTTGSCPRAARRSEGSTKPIDFFIRNGTERFSDYIPQDLSSAAQDKLRIRMQQAPTGSAAKGYIYAFEIASMSTDDHICIKLGRTTDPEEPLRQWRSQCPSSQIKPGGLWPTSENQADKSAIGFSSAQMIDYCSTLEDLVRPELENIAHYSGHTSESRDSYKSSLAKCKNCLARHNDIYTIKRHRGNDGKTDWDFLGDIVQRWAGFVTRYCGHPQTPRRWRLLDIWVAY
ncbi:hypothetical protein BDV93DRAFT_607842 [Ceratobasidium sp. AG-I]|nr:hypothetical protein BDV93DRAFT_607842 [Ceratobasidium sp. AG-I]